MCAKIIRDVIWDDIEIDDFYLEFIKQEKFQRLRRIKQLGMADLIYPNAKHTRFEHSIGTFSAAQKIIDPIKDKISEIGSRDDIIRTILSYALLHDISHIPFGHTIEDEGGLFPRHDEENARIKFFLQDMKSSIPKDTYKMMVNGIKNISKEKHFIYDIVSNTICADLVDYIQRDGYFTGATGLRFKFDNRFLRFLTLCEDHEGNTRLVFKPVKDKIRIDVITDIIQLLRYRYMLTERVTYHHTRCAANAMIIKAVQLLNPPITEFYWLGDNDVLNMLEKSEDEIVSRFGHMLKYRQLYKNIFRVTRDAVKSSPEGTVSDFSTKYGNPMGRNKLEEEIINELAKKNIHLKEGDIIVYCPSAEDMHLKETEVMVLWKGVKAFRLREAPRDEPWEEKISQEVIALEDKYRALWNMNIFIHPRLIKSSYYIESICSKILCVPNDPLLKKSLETYADYKRPQHLQTLLDKTDIVQKAERIAEASSRKGTITDDRQYLEEAINEYVAEKQKKGERKKQKNKSQEEPYDDGKL